MFKTWLSQHLLLPPKDLVYSRRRLVRSVFLIALVMIPLVLALIFMDGMMQGITDKYILLQDGHLQLYTPEDFAIDDAAIFSADRVVNGYGIIYSKEQSSEVKLKGVKTGYFNPKREAELNLETTDVLQRSSVTPIMVSETLAKMLNVEKGDRVAFILIPEEEGRGARPLLAQISDTYYTNYYELDSALVYLDYADAQKYLPSGGKSYLEVLLTAKATNQLSAVAQRVAQGYSWASWDQFNQTVYHNFVSSRQVIFLVFLLILLVAGVYVASLSNELIQDSYQSIALYKALGAQQKDLSCVFYSVVMLITLTGLVLGLLLGILLGYLLSPFLLWLSKSGLEGLRYYLLDFNVVIAWRDLLFIGASMVIIASITVGFTLARIKKISPLEVLQQD